MVCYNVCLVYLFAAVTVVILLIFAAICEKRTAALSPEHIHRKNTKIPIPLHIQFKVIH